MATVRISDIVEPYGGEGDIVQWLERLTMVVKRLKETALADVLPLYLVGPAYAVYSELPDSDKDDADIIKATLKEAFGLNPFVAYEELTVRKWRRGEAVDVYMAELRRLAKLAEVTDEMVIRRQFIVGLPPVVSRELRAMKDVSSASLSSILSRARALMAESSVSQTTAVFAVAKIDRQQNVISGRKGSDPESRRCYRCGGPHLIRYCTKAIITQGNYLGKAAAPEAFPKTQ
jgi:hypothetical protein